MSTRLPPPKSVLLGALFVLALFVAVAAIGTDIMHRAGGMTPAATAPAAIEAARPGDELKVVARIDARNGDRLEAMALAKIDDSTYHATATRIATTRAKPPLCNTTSLSAIHRSRSTPRTSSTRARSAMRGSAM